MVKQLAHTDIASMTELELSKNFDLLRIVVAGKRLPARSDQAAFPFNICSKHIRDRRYGSNRGLSNDFNGVPSAGL